MKKSKGLRVRTLRCYRLPKEPAEAGMKKGVCPPTVQVRQYADSEGEACWGIVNRSGTGIIEVISSGILHNAVFQPRAIPILHAGHTARVGLLGYLVLSSTPDSDIRGQFKRTTTLGHLVTPGTIYTFDDRRPVLRCPALTLTKFGPKAHFKEPLLAAKASLVAAAA